MSFPEALPEPRTPDPMAAPALSWGVMGTGWIVSTFVSAVQRNTRQHFVAVGSRDARRAADAASRLGIARSYGSYEMLATDPEVDVVYVGSGHLDHVECARIALEHGKHVLVEKPLAINAVDAAELAALAARKGLFCAEALWSAFLPRHDVVRQVLESGVLGRIHTVSADLGELLPPGHRIFDPERAGGAMLDLGTYPFWFATWVLGEPASLQARSVDHPSGVHGQVAAILDHDGAQAVVHASVLSDTPTTAAICGTEGVLTLPGPFYHPGDVVLTSSGGGTTLRWSEPAIGHEGLFHEAAEAARCVAAGLTGTSLRPLADTVATLRTMDAVRARCAITFPGETA